MSELEKKVINKLMCFGVLPEKKNLKIVDELIELIKNEPPNPLPNNLDINLLTKLLKYSDRYEINIQFWPGQTAVYIEKDGIELSEFGGDSEFSLRKSLEYLNRINLVKS